MGPQVLQLLQPTSKMTYAVIDSQTNICENIVLWDGVTEWTPPEGCYIKDVTGIYAGIGWSFVNGEWIAPTPQPEPEI
jgi:hypothetical protein